MRNEEYLKLWGDPRSYSLGTQVVMADRQIKRGLSNGKVLFDECKRVNPNSHQIESAEEIDMKWLETAQSVGICGATSTPKWLMEDCRKLIVGRVSPDREEKEDNNNNNN